MISLRHRSSPTAVFLSLGIQQAVQVGQTVNIRVAVSSDGVVQSPIRLQGDSKEVGSIIVNGATSTPASHELRFTPASPGRRRLQIHAFLGDQVVQSAVVEVDVAAASAPEDEAKSKLRKLWGDD